MKTKRYDISQHSAAGQAALRKKKGDKYSEYMSLNGKVGRRVQLALQRRAKKVVR